MREKRLEGGQDIPALGGLRLRWWWDEQACRPHHRFRGSRAHFMSSVIREPRWPLQKEGAHFEEECRPLSEQED